MAKRFGLLFSILMLFFGIITSFYANLKWILIVIILYGATIVFQFFRKKLFRIYGLWFGVFLVVQTLLSPVVFNNSFKTLKPLLKRVIDVRNGVPGLYGIQHITADAKGFRTTKNLNYAAKNKNVYRIFAIGGSTTEQLLLDDLRTWTHLLQENLDSHFQHTDIQVINTGVSGTRLCHHYRTLKEIAEFHPDMVLFLVGLNDWSYHIMLHFNPLMPLSFDRTLLGKFIRRTFYNILAYMDGSAKDDKIEVFDGTDYATKRNSLSREDKRQFRPISVSTNYSKYLKRIVSFCNNERIPCAFFTQPNGYHNLAALQYKKGFWMTPPETKYTLDLESMIYISQLYNNYLVHFTSGSGVEVFDLSKMIPGSYAVMYDECHFNTKGAKEVSRHLSTFLQPIIAKRVGRSSY